MKSKHDQTGKSKSKEKQFNFKERDQRDPSCHYASQRKTI